MASLGCHQRPGSLVETEHGTVVQARGMVGPPDSSSSSTSIVPAVRAGAASFVLDVPQCTCCDDAVPHRLNAEERKIYESAKKKGYLAVRGTGYRRERKGNPLPNSFRQWCDAKGMACVV